jgi:hypothetical protein
MHCGTVLLLLAATLQHPRSVNPIASVTGLGPGPLHPWVGSWVDDSKPQGLCNKSESICVCHFDNRSKIDLNPLSEAVSRLHATGLGGLNYTYQPCSDFTTELCKTATAICQSNDTAGVGVNCGTARNATFVYDNSDNYVSLQYENGDKVNGRARKSVVRLVCNDSVTIPQLTALGDFFATDVYEFKLVSKHCCPVPYQLQARYFSMSIGSLLIILYVLNYRSTVISN